MVKHVEVDSVGGASNRIGKQPVPSYCELEMTIDGEGYIRLDLDDIHFELYDDEKRNYYIQCKPKDAGNPAFLQFRGEDLTSYSKYIISGDSEPGHVFTFFEISDFADGTFGDPSGEFRVKKVTEDIDGLWFIAEFDFNVLFYPRDSTKEVVYHVKSQQFQVQVNA
ncbi:hypothetical protein [Pseudomonas sp.]|uniref:hypothetical protein n=1 Tax=Pseudomonas sp. TaxID=306 RepID=UPI0026275071|nr:hypothetical protein [Pseudomonas sp.]